MSDSDLDDDARALRDQACAALVAKVVEQAGDAHDAGAIESFVSGLFGTYFATSRKKGEDPEQAAQKISKIVGKQAAKKFAPPKPEPEPEPEPQAEAERQPGQVTGKTAGIDRKIMNILNEVSSHYGEPINIVSGVRSKPAQVQAMYTNWQSHLRNGKDNPFIAGDEKLRQQLDRLKQDKNKSGFIELLTKKADWNALTRHMSGAEVDLAANTNPSIVAALATCLNHRSGRNSEGARVHHFDNTKLVWPIIQSTRDRWPD